MHKLWIPNHLLSSFLILFGVFFITEFSILILDGLLQILSLLIGKPHNLVHGWVTLTVAAFFIWIWALLLGCLECDCLFRRLITIKRIRLELDYAYPFLDFFYSSLVSRRLFLVPAPVLELVSFFVSAASNWDWSLLEEVLWINNEALSSMLWKEA